MRTFLISLVLMFAAVSQLMGQSKSEMLTNIRRTMNDFSADLGIVNENNKSDEQLIASIADNFGYAEYFTKNGKQNASFRKWLDSYCRIELGGYTVQHSIKVFDHSFTKVNPNVKEEKLYRFNAAWSRTFNNGSETITIPEDTLTFTVLWRSKEQYVSITGIQGNMHVVSLMLDERKAEPEFKSWVQDAQNGDLFAQVEIGAYYFNGIKVKQDYGKAVFWFQKAAEQNYNSALNWLAYCYQQGKGVPKDMDKAIGLYTEAAVKGYARAQYNLGRCYEKGEGVSIDMVKAIELYTQAAEKGDEGAQSQLGVKYYYGEGVQKDYKRAVHWFQKAADQNHDGAINWLGWCYQYGNGVPKDIDKAIGLYIKAAEKGYANAQYNLGICYKQKAVEWLTKAAKNGESDAQTELNKLK